MKKLTILETTLRDGSYSVNFSFTSADTMIICQELEKAGFEYIEIGHGVGLNASNQGFGTATQTDEEYMRAAASGLKRARYGMFCIPGIARLEDLDPAAEHGMGFIRVGTDVTKVPQAEKFVEKAKKQGLVVAVNFMKSYCLPPKQFAEKVKLVEKYGADIVYIVDSAGGMFSNDIKDYFNAVREVSEITVGFHGHDNLGLAIANNLEAVKIGIGFIDSSLQGLGRSAGNAATEILVSALLKLGYEVKVDLLKLLEIGEKYIRPLMSGNRGHHLLDIVSGYADFHSSYMHYIHEYSTKYQINPALLIIELCKVDKMNVKKELLEDVAGRIKKHEDVFSGKYNFSGYFGREQDDK